MILACKEDKNLYPPITDSCSPQWKHDFSEKFNCNSTSHPII